MNISVLGCGRWGSFHAWYADHIGHTVTLWGRKGSGHLAALMEQRKNEYLTLPESVKLTDDLREAVSAADIVVISISSQQLRAFCRDLAALGLDLSGKRFVLCMKGLEIGTGKRLTTVLYEELGSAMRVAVWVGPGHVQDFVRGIPNCMVIAAREMKLTRELVDTFSSPLIRFYYGDDLIGNEIGAAAKNVVGIAAGMLDGYGLTSLKGALMARGTREVGRLIGALGGSERSAYGLAHLGDYEATVFSPYSHNRAFGERFVRGERYAQLAEGMATAKALRVLSTRCGVGLPICGAVYDVLYEGVNPREALSNLFLRSLKREF